MQQFHLVKKDIDPITSLEIATYQMDSAQFVVCKNSKQIGWAITEQDALLIHDMYTRIHILQETDADPNYDAKIKAMRTSPQNNGFLHDLPEEILAERKKLLPWNQNS